MIYLQLPIGKPSAGRVLVWFIQGIYPIASIPLSYLRIAGLPTSHVNMPILPMEGHSLAESEARK